MAAGNIPSELKFEELRTYDEVLSYLESRNREKHLLLGNGFSMAYDQEIFSYNALYDFIEKLDDPTLSKLFKVVNTKNFEQVMRQLDNFIEMAEAFDDKGKLTEALQNANELLQQSLIEAVSSMHPEHVFELTEEKSAACYAFLNEYIGNNGKLFSTNYDLLLYWVLMRNNSSHSIDGFGRELLNPKDLKKGAEPEFGELHWGKNKEEQSVFHVHGTLPFFDTELEIEKEVYTGESYLLENIKERMERKEYPIFVTAGDGEEKLKQIYRNRYLTYCYENLSKIQGSLISFGFNFGEYDEHIIDAINKAAKYGAQSGEKLMSIYVGVFSERGLEHIKSIQHKFDCRVNVYNSQTANIWG